MNSNKTKFNKILILFWGVINTIYATYLICRLDNYKIKEILLIGFIILLLLIWLIRFSKKNINQEKIAKNKKGLFWLSLFCTFLILGTNWNFFTKAFIDNQVEMKMATSNLNSEFINSVLINNVVFKKQNNNFIQDYTQDINKDIVLNFDGIDTYTLNFKKAYNIKIEFNDNANNLIIKNRNTNEQIEVLEGESYYYNVNNTIFNNYSFIRLALSIQLILGVVILLIANFESFENKYSKNLILLIVMVIVIGLVYRNNLIFKVLYPDSESYINYDFPRLFQGHLDGRTPIYPLIIKIMSLLFANKYLSFVCLFQYVIWFISIIYLYKLLFLLLKNANLSLIFSIFYACYPAIFSWNNLLLTESLTLSGTMIFMYYIINFLKQEDIRSAIKAIILSFILTFERPTSVILVVILLIFWIMRLIFKAGNFKKNIIGLTGSLISLSLIMGYAILFHRDYGIYSISDRAVTQGLYVIINEGYYKSSDNLEFIQDVDKTLEEYNDNVMDTTWVISLKYSLKEIKEITSDCRNKNFSSYIVYLTKLLKFYANARFEGYSFINTNNLTWLHNSIYTVFNIFTFFHVYIAILIEFLLMIKKWLTTKKIPWLYCGLFSFPLVIVLASFMGTFDEFMRTAICCLPFIYLTYVLLIAKIFKVNNSDC